MTIKRGKRNQSRLENQPDKQRTGKYGSFVFKSTSIHTSIHTSSAMFRPLTSISVRGANLLRQCRCTQLQSFTRSAHLHPPSTSQTSSRAASSQAVPLHPPTLNLTNESPCSGSRSSDMHAYPSGDSVIVSWPDGKESRL